MMMENIGHKLLPNEYPVDYLSRSPIASRGFEKAGLLNRLVRQLLF